MVAVGAGVVLWDRLQKAPSGKLYVADTFGDDVGVIDVRTGKLRTLIPTGKLPHNFALTSDTHTLFVTESGSQSVSVIDTTTDKVVRQRIVGPIPDLPAHRKLGMAQVAAAPSCKSCHEARPVGTFISGISLSPDERELWITEMKTGRLVVADATTLETKRRVFVDTPTPATPSNVVVHPLTHDAWVFSRMVKGHAGVEGVTDKGTGKYHGGYDMMGSGAPPHPVPPSGQKGGFDHDVKGPGSSWISIYDSTLTTLKGRLKVPYSVPYQGVFSPDGKELYVSYRSTDKVAVIDAEKFVMTKSFTVDEAPIGMVLVDDDTLAVACFYETPATLVFIDRHSGALKHRLEVPSSPILLRLHPRTKLLYLSVSGDNKLVEIDPAVPAIRRVFDAGAYPVDVELVP